MLMSHIMEQRVGFEPTVFEICSHVLWATQPPLHYMERDIGIEPMTKDWKSLVLPLN